MVGWNMYASPDPFALLSSFLLIMPPIFIPHIIHSAFRFLCDTPPCGLLTISLLFFLPHVPELCSRVLSSGKAKGQCVYIVCVRTRRVC